MFFSQMLAVAAFFAPLWCAFKISSTLSPIRSLSERVLETIVGYLLLTQLAVLAMGLTSHLNRAGFIISTIAMVALTSLAGARWRAQRDARNVAFEDGRPAPTCILAQLRSDRVPQIIAIACLAPPIIHWLIIVFVRPTTITVDDSNYHATISFAWLQRQQFLILPIDIGAAFPFGAELLPIWHMLPFHGRSLADMLAWTNVPAASWMLLCLVAPSALATRLGVIPGSWVFAALLALSGPVLVDMNAGSFASVDNALPALIVTSLVLIISLSDREKPMTESEWHGRCGFIAAPLGLAMGVKFTALPLVAVLYSVVVGLAWRRAGWRGATATGTLALLLIVGIGGYWYLRNAIYFGNPLFPASVFGLPGQSCGLEFSIARYIDLYGWRKSIRDILDVYMAWPTSFGCLAVGGLLFGPPLAVLVEKERRKDFLMAASITWAIALVVVALLPWQAFSAGHGGNFQLGQVHPCSMRYVTILPVLGWLWVAIAIGLPRLPGRIRCALASAVLVVVAFDQSLLIGAAFARAIWKRFAEQPRMFLAVTIVALAAGFLRPRIHPWRMFWKAKPIVAPVALAATFAVALTLLWASHGQKRNATHARTLQSPFGFDIHAEIQLLDRLPKKKVIGTCGQYLFFGANLQHEPIFFRQLCLDTFSPGDRFDRASWCQTPLSTDERRDRIARADIVLCIEPPCCGAFLEEMQAHPQFSLLQRSKHAAIFERKSDMSSQLATAHSD